MSTKSSGSPRCKALSASPPPRRRTRSPCPIIETKGIDHKVVAREKARTLKKNGLVEVVEATTSLDDIGGLGLLKEWLVRRGGAFSASAKAYGLPAPKGLLIVGIPGTGKSLTAKATAGAFGLPLLRLDMGRVFGGIVGQSEANLRSVIQTAEAIAPCVLWIDEIEKGFSGSQSSGSTDGGTSSRVFGTFPFLDAGKGQTGVRGGDGERCFANCRRSSCAKEGSMNCSSSICPMPLERAQIWDIVIKRHGRKPTDYDTVVLARACEQFTGAEIEAVFIDAMHEAYAEGKEPGPKEILEAMTHTVPLANLMDGQIAALRHWAKGRAREAASRVAPSRNSRRIAEAN